MTESLREKVVWEARLKRECVQCGTTYSGAEVGRLACKFHPCAWTARQLSSDRQIRATAATDCRSCQLMLRTPAMRLPDEVAEVARHMEGHRGCTAIDHAADQRALIQARPYALLAAIFGEPFTVLQGVRRGVLPANVRFFGGPECLGRTLCIRWRGTPVASTVRVGVAALYAQMTQQYGFHDYCARPAGPVGSRQTTKLQRFQHPDALRKKTLYSAGDGGGEGQFHPFYFVARMECTLALE